MRRWTIRILLILLILLLLAAAVVQGVLWTDWPRKMVVQELQQTLGMRVKMESLSVGWFGSSSLRNVEFALPLTEEPLATAPRVRVSHASVPALILGRPLNLTVIDLDDAKLIARQELSGRWNVQDVIERTFAGSPADSTRSPRSLPKIVIKNGMLTIIDRKNRQAVISPVSFTGHPDTALLWKYDAEVPDQLKVVGEIAPGGSWKHQFDVQVRKTDPWIAAWIKNWPDNAALDGRWSGQFEPGGISGRLDVRQVNFGNYRAAGGLVAQGDPSNLRIRPEQFTILDDTEMLPEIRSAGGSVMLIGSTLMTEGLRVAMGGGLADVDGEWNFFNGTAAFTADWETIALPAGFTHSGTVKGSILQPWPNQLQLELEVKARGNAYAGDFNADLKLTGEGADWSALNLKLTAPALSWAGGRTVAFNDVVASFVTQGPTITLSDITANSQGRITGNGAINLETRDWRLWLDAGGWTLPRVEDATLNFMVNVWGNADKVRLKQLYLRSGDVDVVLDGWYVYTHPKPLDAAVYLTHLPPVAGGIGEEQSKFVRGKLLGDGHLNGTVNPLALEVEGTLFGKNVFIRQRPLGDIAIILKGTINEKEAQFESKELALLGGKWLLRGYHPLGPEPMRVSIEVQDLPLAEISDLMENVDFSGSMDGRWILDVPEWSRQGIVAKGSFEIDEARAPHFAADRIEARMAMENSLLGVDPIVMRRGAGSADATLAIDTTDFRTLKLKFAATDWPFEPDGTHLTAGVTGNADVEIDLNNRSAFGAVNLTAKVASDGEAIGDARLAAQLTDRIIDLRTFEVDTLGGHFTSSATFGVDDPLQTIAQAEWHGVTADELVKMYPRLSGLAGSFSGAAKMSPSKDPRAIEPLRLNVAVEAESANYKGIQIGNAELNAFLNTNRLVLDRSTFLIAGGTLEAWLRSSRRAGDPLHSQLIVHYDKLDLNQLVHAADSTADDFPGRLAGHFTLVGSPRVPDNIFGDGVVRLTESDLRNSDIFSTLYNAMRLDFNQSEPLGHGAGSLRMQQSALDIMQLRYYNRGVEVRANMTIEDVWKLKKAPIFGFAVGTARPLKEIKLPWLADADQIFNVLQRDLTTVRVSGEVGQPDVTTAAFSELSQSMRRFLFGDVKHDSMDNSAK